MENEFKKWWEHQKECFDVSKPMDPESIELIILAVAYNAWQAATKIKKTDGTNYNEKR